MSVTALYGARSAGSPFGAWIVTHRCSESTAGCPEHQPGSPREVDRQYAKRSCSGKVFAHQGSSAPFHRPIAPLYASRSSVVMTSTSRSALASPGAALLRVARLTHVYASRSAASRLHARASVRSAAFQAVVAGPTLKKLTPAPTTSSSASAPVGVIAPRSGPFASTIGKTLRPSSSVVPYGSSRVLAPAAPCTATIAATASAVSSSRPLVAEPLAKQPPFRPGQGTPIFGA